MVARLVRDEEVPGSNPGNPTNQSPSCLGSSGLVGPWYPGTTLEQVLLDEFRSRGAEQLRRSLVGDEALATDELASPDDPGWFGPASVSWRVHGDASTLVGGLSALLIQTLHPLAMAGVDDHSDYRDDPWGRLNRTGRFIGATTFGSTATADTAVAVVRSIHQRVQGVTPDGQTYRADDPHLLGWVHCTEVDAFCRAYDRYAAGVLRSDERDDYVAEMSRVGHALGGEDLPITFTQLQQRLIAYRSECELTEVARRTIGFLADPPMPGPSRLGYRVLFAAAVDLMPPWAREIAELDAGVERVAVRPAALALSRGIGWLLGQGDPDSANPQRRISA